MGEWISVKEQLPEYRKPVLIVTKCGLLNSFTPMRFERSPLRERKSNTQEDNMPFARRKGK